MYMTLDHYWFIYFPSIVFSNNHLFYINGIYDVSQAACINYIKSMCKAKTITVFFIILEEFQLKTINVRLEIKRAASENALLNVQLQHHYTWNKDNVHVWILALNSCSRRYHLSSKQQPHHQFVVFYYYQLP